MAKHSALGTDALIFMIGYIAFSIVIRIHSRQEETR